MSGARQPASRIRRLISGTAAAAAGVFTVTRTSSDPASASSTHCAAVAAASAVSVMVIDCTAMGAPPPIWTSPTRTPVVRCSLTVFMASFDAEAGTWAAGQSTTGPARAPAATGGWVHDTRVRILRSAATPARRRPPSPTAPDGHLTIPVVHLRRVAGPEAGGAEARDQRAAAALRRRRGISPRASRAAATVRSTSRRVWAAERNQPSNCDGGG